MAATTKLIVYNATLRELGGHPLANTSTVNTSLTELEGAFAHAVEHLLSRLDWSFARRRATLASVSDTSYPPYTYRYTRPSDYLRKCWIKTAAANDYQIDHAESASAIYGYETAPIIEYISDHADVYDPANWPPHFTRALTTYLASLVGPKLARAGGEQLGKLREGFDTALADAKDFEANFVTNTQIAADRQPVFRRAIEFMGQSLAGSVAIHAHTDKMRWQMNLSWEHAVRYVLELGAWNFASKRAYLTNGVTGDSLMPSTTGGIIEGYSLEPADAEDDPVVAGYDYGYALPDDFLHKIWLKRAPDADLESDHQFVGAYVFVREDPVIMEYVAYNATTRDPANWSANFMEAVAAYLAVLVAPQFVLDEGRKGKGALNAPQVQEKMEAVFKLKLRDAKMRDAIQQQPYRMPLGRFARARMGGNVVSLRNR